MGQARLYDAVETILSAPNMLIRRGQRRHDGAPVILKSLRDNAAPADLARLRHEHLLSTQLAIDAICPVLDILTLDGMPTLVSADLSAIPLRQWMQADHGLEARLAVAEGLAQAVVALHEAGVVHRDVNPDNVIVHPASLRVWLIDLGLATLSLHRTQEPLHPQDLEGTLAYLAPEQTGRLPRTVDQRSDLYALGVTLFELFSSELPFPASDPLELVHAHLARTPPVLLDRAPGVPTALSSLVALLLEKRPEDRYQQAAAVLDDLRLIRQGLADGHSTADLKPGLRDRDTRFSVPQRLYGRERQRRRLFQFVERAAGGENDFVVITGDSGIGKSVLVSTVIYRSESFSFRTVIAKFTRVPQIEPAAPVVLAFAPLLRRMLSAPTAVMLQWRDRLRHALGRDAELLCEALPDLAALLGLDEVQPRPRTRETGQRFDQAFRKLVEGCADSSSPLLLVLEGCEWIDPDSRRLIQLSTGPGGVPHLLILATTADTDLAATTLGPLYPAAGPNQIEVEPLTEAETTALVTDVLHTQAERVTDLAARIHAKSRGNPMLALDTLESLRGQGLLRYDRDQHDWTWSASALAASPLLRPDTDVLLARLGRLPGTTVAPLEVAACIGERFDVPWLAHAMDLDVHGVLQRLRPALEEGFIAPEGERPLLPQQEAEPLAQSNVEAPLRLCFASTRIHRQVYQQLTPERRGNLHRRIGNILLAAAQLAEEQDPDAGQHLLLDAVSQFNFASTLPSEDEDTGTAASKELAQLNLRAGRIALGSGQPQGAFRFLRTGMGQLGSEAWTRHPVVMAQLSSTALDAAFLCADPGQVERLSRAALAQPLDAAIRLRMVAMLVRACFAQGRHEDGMAMALPELARQGLPLPSRLPARLERLLLLRDARRLARRPLPPPPAPGQDLDHSLTARHQLLLDVAHSAFFTNHRVQLTALRHLLAGSTHDRPAPESAYALACAAAIALVSGWPRLARQLSGRSEALLQADGNSRAAVRSRIVLESLVHPWFRPPRLSLKPLLEAFDDGLTAGDLEAASQAAAAYAAGAVLNGESLPALREQLRRLERTLGVYPPPPSLPLLTQYARFIDRLMTADAATPPDRPQTGNPPTTGLNHEALLQAWWCLLEGDAAGTLTALTPLQPSTLALLPSTAACQLQWLWALACIDVAANQQGRPRRRLLSQARRARQRIQRWVAMGLPRFQCRVTLIDAELAAVGRQRHRALDLFARALHQARAADLDPDEALVWERTARCCLDGDREAFYEHFMQGAQRAWAHWGAQARMAALHNADSGHGKQLAATLRSRRSGSQAATHLDTVAMLEAARTIASEVQLDELLRILVGLVLESSGAERTALILLEDSRPVLTATASSDSRQVLDPPLPLLDCGDQIPVSVLQYVARSRQTLVLEDATIEDAFSDDRYVLEHRPRALACVPLNIGGRQIGMLYAEHRRQTDAFGQERLEIMRLLAAQAAIGIDNARLYQALAQARDEYRDLFDHAAEGIFRTDVEGRLQRGNRALAEALGYASVDDLLGSLRFLPRDLAAEPADAARLLDEIHSSDGIQGFQLEGFRSDGRRRWFAISARLLRSEDGEKLAIEGSLVDVSERRQRLQAERERELAEAATAAKSRFLANMSHEIRTPMNAVLGFSELMLGTALDSRQREFATTIHSAAESLLRLINDILDFSRIEAGQLSLVQEPLDLPGLLAELETLFASSARQKGLQLRCHGGDALRRALSGPERLHGDSGRLRQVLINLLGNALKFTTEGHIELNIEVLEQRDDRARLGFSVEDTGMGIAQADQARLFRSFEQIDVGRARQHGGAGLGLAISQQLVTLMGGELTVSSEPGHGSRFRFELDLPCFEPLTSSDLAASAPQAGALAGCSILLAEDNRINQQLAAAFLEQAGASVHVVDAGAEVLAALREQAFDAVLMDLHMPGMDGIETCRALRALEVGSRLPVIAVTADAARDSITRARQAGFDDYVLKPLTMASLVGTLLQHLPNTVLPSSPAVAALPLAGQRLPGLDLPRAMRHHNDNPALLFRLAQQFVDLYGEAPRLLAEALDAGAAEQAIRLAHNLHGVAGSFGAERLRLAARKLEHALERQPDLAAAPMEEFGAALAEVVASMEALLARHSA